MTLAPAGQGATQTWKSVAADLYAQADKVEQGDHVRRSFGYDHKKGGPQVDVSKAFSDLTVGDMQRVLAAKQKAETSKGSSSGKDGPSKGKGKEKGGQGGKEKQKFSGKCNYCQKQGHKEKDCRIRIADEAEASGRSPRNSARNGSNATRFDSSSSRSSSQGSARSGPSSNTRSQRTLAAAQRRQEREEDGILDEAQEIMERRSADNRSFDRAAADRDDVMMSLIKDMRDDLKSTKTRLEKAGF